jgi:hypothetical protein
MLHPVFCSALTQIKPRAATKCRISARGREPRLDFPPLASAIAALLFFP